MIKKTISAISTMILLMLVTNTFAAEDNRQFVKLPEMMQHHMLASMRDHLQTLNDILKYLSTGEMDKAASTAEHRLGMSSLGSHDAAHMAKFMPDGMQHAGTAMHKAASQFALKAEEGEVLPAYKMLSTITSSCVACHAGYRIR